MAKNQAGFPSNKEDDDDWHRKLELMLENAGVPGHSVYGPIPFSADEWMGAGPPCEGSEGWPEWKIEDDLACARFIDDLCERDDGCQF
jgi:hypothetical protein